MVRKVRRRSIAQRLRTLEGFTDLKRSKSLAQARRVKADAITLIGLLGSQRMVDDARSGKWTVEATLTNISKTEGLTPAKRRVAAMGARAAKVEGI